MISFKKFYEAVTKSPGNYVSIDARDPNGFTIPNELRPKTGTEVKLDDRHVTLIYSTNSSLDHNRLLRVIESEFPKKIQANIVGFDCFDALPKDGEHDEGKATLVMKLESPILDKIHARLIQLGCRHSYDEFSAHISLYYNVDRDECHALQKKLSRDISQPMKINLSGYTSEPIDED